MKFTSLLERRRKSSREWAMRNQAYVREVGRIWREENREHWLELKCEQQRRYRKRYPLKVWITNRKLYAMRKKAKGNFSLQDWKLILKKYRNCCAKCHKFPPFKNQFHSGLVVDHIIPLSRGGTNEILNIQPLCFNCNATKYNRL